MTISEAVAGRILELCRKRGMTVNKLATESGVTQSTVNEIVNGVTKNFGIVTLKKLIDGFGGDMNIKKFFDADIFEHLEQETR